jgi:hypothetical protein
MCREHLAVRVDLDPRPLDLLQQVLQVDHVVAGDEDPGALLDPLLHLDRTRLTELVDMRVVEQFHRPQVHPAALEHELEQALDVEIDVGHGGEQRLLDERIHLLVHRTQSARVVLVGGHPPLEAVKQDLLEGLHVGVLPAHPLLGAGHATVGLLALVTEHVAHKRRDSDCGGRMARAARYCLDAGQESVAFPRTRR